MRCPTLISVNRRSPQADRAVSEFRSSGKCAGLAAFGERFDFLTRAPPGRDGGPWGGRDPMPVGVELAEAAAAAFNGVNGEFALLA